MYTKKIILRLEKILCAPKINLFLEKLYPVEEFWIYLDDFDRDHKNTMIPIFWTQETVSSKSRNELQIERHRIWARKKRPLQAIRL